MLGWTMTIPIHVKPENAGAVAICESKTSLYQQLYPLASTAYFTATKTYLISSFTDIRNMVLKLVGNKIASCTHRVALVLHEKQVPFEFVNIDFKKGEHKAPEFLKHQPFGQVPYIDDDGFILYESRAIAEYIALKYPDQGTKLVPTELKALALSKQAASVELNNFNEYAEKAVAEVVFKRFWGVEPDQTVFEKLISALDKKLDVYDQILSKQKYLAGDDITLADLYHLPYGSLLSVAGSDIMERKPHVARWFADLSSRPSWQALKDGVVATA
ncbi:hypothetical protein D9619_003956 [Psilocybe cf. subviscida]|uniref:glutathione transferase n=1 Tax=Psilocybe cf. subviscida TaxID=2480587 RepID=A0A8H5BQK5_9AGAR|nr:hypothetical protein D9619_003956 [Psilocybe cf. subviscida]